MNAEPVTRVLVVADATALTAELVDALRARAEHGAVQLRLVVPNPAGAELHLLHPERHEKAAEAEHALRAVLPEIEAAVGDHVIGSVSVRHDPIDAVEDILFAEPVHEILLAVSTHRISHWLHQDLPHRLAHYGLPVSSIAAGARS
ncbi:hypothetical protein [Marmoricola sp. RAF53]|uniref:hypothetical protein n=1 Tax=Marmoricola sp. RAF53 TaxID=3233059 RepID=UPI003F98FC8F